MRLRAIDQGMDGGNPRLNFNACDIVMEKRMGHDLANCIETRRQQTPDNNGALSLWGSPGLMCRRQRRRHRHEHRAPATTNVSTRMPNVVKLRGVIDIRKKKCVSEHGPNRDHASSFNLPSPPVYEHRQPMNYLQHATTTTRNNDQKHLMWATTPCADAQYNKRINTI